jgi:hypothetical protein
MRQDSKFLGNKTSEQTVYPVFRGVQTPKVCGLLLKNDRKAWRYFDSGNELSWEKDFSFDWAKPFEIIFIFSSQMYTEQWAKLEPLKFPISVTVFQKSGPEGPTYEADCVCINKEELYYPTDPQYSAMETLFRKTGVAKPDEHFESWNTNDWQHILKNGPSFLFAVRPEFNFCVEDDQENKHSIQGLRPFGKAYLPKASGHYTYEFALKSEKYGIPEAHKISYPKINFPGLPDKTVWKFPINETFVTKSILVHELSVVKTDYLG